MSAEADPRPPAAGPRRRARAWALLDRTPMFVAAAELPAPGVEFAVRHATPPALSTLFVMRALIPPGDHDGHVECADGDGNLLLSVRPVHEGAAPSLLVFRAGARRAHLVPNVPVGLGVLRFGIAAGACTGILAVAPAAYVLVQIQRAEAGDSTPRAVHLQHVAAGGSASRPSSSSAPRMQRAAAGGSASRPSSSSAPRTQRAAAGGSASRSSSSSAPRTAHLLTAPSTTSSSSSSVHLRALCYSSSSSSWTATDVSAELPRRYEALSDEDDEWGVKVQEVAGAHDRRVLDFEPHTVVSHDEGSQLLFVDLKLGLILIFSPMAAGAAAARFVPFPGTDGGGLAADAREAARHRCVAFSQGRLSVVDISGGNVNVSRLMEEHDEWVPLFSVGTDEVFWCHASIGKQLRGFDFGVGSVDPTDPYRLGFFAPDAVLGFTAVVRPGEMFGHRVRLGAQADAASRGSCLDLLVWRFDPADPAAVAAAPAARGGGTRRWIRKLKHVGIKAVKTCRKHADKIPPAAKALGGAATYFGCGQLGAAMVGTGAAVATASNVVVAGEHINRTIGTWWTSDDELDVKIVGNLGDAIRVLQQWRSAGMPENMVVDAAPGTRQEVVDRLRHFFDTNGAQSLPWKFSDYQMVSRAPHF